MHLLFQLLLVVKGYNNFTQPQQWTPWLSLVAAHFWNDSFGEYREGELLLETSGLHETMFYTIKTANDVSTKH